MAAAVLCAIFRNRAKIGHNGVLKKVLLGEKHALLEVPMNSGSNRSFITAERRKSMGLYFCARKGSTCLANGEKLQCPGLGNTQVSVGQYYYTANFVVARDLLEDTRFGPDVLLRHEEVTMLIHGPISFGKKIFESRLQNLLTEKLSR